MGIFSPKERLDRILHKQAIDRPPVICPGGMMNSAIVEIMQKTGHLLPAAHRDADLMTELAQDVQRYTGFENLGVPFCMTVEAEALGSEIDDGTLECEPKIHREVFANSHDVIFKDKKAIEDNARIGTIVETIYRLSKKNPDVPVIGSITGPLSTAASIVDPMTFLKQLRKEKEVSHEVLDYVTKQLIHFAQLMVDNGATAISIADPTATGEILGPKMFEEYAVRYLNQLTDAIHQMGVPVIIHICGRMQAVTGSISNLHSDALSVDALVNLKKVKEEYPHITTMGNLSTYMLEFGKPDAVERMTEKLLKDNIQIMAPACGLSTSTPLANITTFTGKVKAI